MDFPIDIIIPTYGREHLVVPLVEALVPQLDERDGIIVVAQGTDAHNRFSKLHASVRLIRRSTPSLPAARNLGLRASQAEVALFLDDDVIPGPGLVAAHRNCYCEATVAGIAGYVDDPLFDRGRTLPSFIDLTNGDIFQNFSLPNNQVTVSAMGANMSFRRSALLDAGGFDEQYLANALWEDIDCCLRLLAKGRTLRYCPAADVKHTRENSGGCRNAGPLRHIYHRFANTAYFKMKFSKPAHRRSWLRAEWYRLEYYSRSGRPKRSVALVAAGLAGMVGGTARYHRTNNGRLSAAEKSVLYSTLTTLGSKA